MYCYVLHNLYCITLICLKKGTSNYTESSFFKLFFEHRNFQTSYSGHPTRDVPHLPDSYARVPNVFLLQKEPTIPNNNPLSEHKMQSLCGSTSLNELEWLNHVHDTIISRDGLLNDVSFSAFHVNKIINNLEDNMCPEKICALLPLFTEDSNAVSMVHHGINIKKNITKYLNPVQTPVMCCDQPLYTIGKLIQMNWPELYGKEKFVLMFAPFHIEKAFLGVIGQYMLGCGWASVAVNAGLASRGSADAILKGTHVKKSRTAHEITAAALFVLLNEAHNTASSDASLDIWIQEQSKKSQTFKFWATFSEVNTTSPENCNKEVYDGAALVHSLPPRSSKTFGEYCRREFHQHILGCTQSTNGRRIDIVWDLYFEKSLKQAERDSRGVGSRRQVREEYKLPNNWSEFLKNAQNKEELFKLLGSYALQQMGVCS